MKKIFKLTLAASLLCGFLSFSGCSDPVFYSVLKDVKSESASVSGTISSITRYTAGAKEFLVVNANSGLRYKSAENTTHGSWKTYSNLPFTLHKYDYYETQTHKGQQILKILADSDTLYLFTVSYKNDYDEGTSVPDTVYLWAKKMTVADDGETWSEDGEWVNLVEDNSSELFTFYEHNDYYYSAFSFFGTNSPNPANRKVYFRSGNSVSSYSSKKTVEYYQLNGLNAPSVIEAAASDSSTTNNIRSAAYFDGQVLFFNSIAVTTNETADTAATMVYYGSGESLYYKAAGAAEFTKAKFSAGETISCLAVCSDALLIGRADYSSTSSSATGGIVKTSLSEGIPGSSLVSFTTNAAIQMPSTYFITCLLNVDPSQAEEDSCLYSAIYFLGSGSSTSVSYSNIGLWSYYPARGNWNRE